jgi:hypothetical protein
MRTFFACARFRVKQMESTPHESRDLIVPRKFSVKSLSAVWQRQQVLARHRAALLRQTEWRCCHGLH